MRVISFVFCMFYFVFYGSSNYIFLQEVFSDSYKYILFTRKKVKIRSNQVHEERVVENSEIKILKIKISLFSVPQLQAYHMSTEQ